LPARLPSDREIEAVAEFLGTVSPLRSRTAWLLVVAWLCVLGWFSLVPQAGLPPAPDYVEHAAAYLILAWLLRRAMAGGGIGRRFVAPVLIAIAYGLLIEVLQTAFSYRTAELRDVIANAAGAAASVIVPVGRAAARAAPEGPA
jgi:VanZ family protein